MSALSERSEQLNAKDSSQALWALAHLHSMEDSRELVEPFAQRVKDVGPAMTGQECANSLWALARLGSKTFDAVFVLTQRVLHLVRERDNQESPSLTPQEAANILTAFGRLQIRHEEIFDRLSAVILHQIDKTTALTIANVLQAHRAVYILPPQELLGTWAKQKLGIDAALDDTGDG